MKKERKRRLGDQACYWLMVLPAVVLVFMFNTRTWPGILIAFEDFIPTLGWFKSEWVGLDNFKVFFSQPDAFRIIKNSFVIATGKILFGMPLYVTFSVMLNEVRNQRLKKTIQTCSYLTHFVSWVIYGTILKSIIGTNGLINNMLTSAGKEKIMFLGLPWLFPILMIVTDCLKEYGYCSILYLSGISGIDPGLYEAAEMDGASRFQLAIHVTIPGISHIICIQACMSLGTILNAGFDQIFNMYNDLVMSTGDIIDTWVYRQGIVGLQFGVSQAVSLCNSIIGMFLVSIAYWAAAKFADYKIF